MFQQSTRHVASYYAHTCADRLVDRVALEGEQDTEVLIIGAGFSGLHTALRLALAGKRVTLLEASRVACRVGAQWRSGHYRAICRRWRPRWVMSARGGCGRHALGRSGVSARRSGRHDFDQDYRPGHLWTSVMPRRVSLLTEWQHEASQ